jgi:uncharacterized repeat protein (TIGR03803 family)
MVSGRMRHIRRLWLMVAALGSMSLAACGGSTTPGSAAGMASSSSSSGGSAALVTLYSFPLVTVAPGNSRQRLPLGSLVQAGDGNLYGATQVGAPLFQITLTGAETDISAPVDTNSSMGSINSPVILGQDGKLYGTSGCSGFLVGSVFASDLAGNFDTLYSYSNAEGCDISPPFGLVQAGSATFYFVGFPYESEIVLALAANTGTTSFVSTPATYPASFGSLVIASDGSIYGLSTLGGTYDAGFVFKITPPSGTVQILYSFGASSGDASNPNALILGSDGNFYGTSNAGGMANAACPSGCGTVFKITPTGPETVLYSFGTNPADGGQPCNYPNAKPSCGSLVQGRDGNFYGATFATIYRITPDGVETVLHTLAPEEGQGVSGALMQANDGNYYGTTVQGGVNDGGTVFKLVPGSH